MSMIGIRVANLATYRDMNGNVLGFRTRERSEDWSSEEKGGLEAPVDKDEDWPLIVNSSYAPHLMVNEDADVRLFFLSHNEVFHIHSQVACLYSDTLKNLIEHCPSTHVYDGKKVILLARTADDTLSRVETDVIFNLLLGMYNSYGLHKVTTEHYNLHQWKGLQLASRYLGVKRGLQRLISSGLDIAVVNDFGPIWKSIIHAADLLEMEFGSKLGTLKVPAIHRLISQARGWETPKAQVQLNKLMPYPECIRAFNMVLLQCVFDAHNAMDRAKEITKKDESFLSRSTSQQTSDTVSNILTSSAISNGDVVYKWLFSHITECVHCQEVQKQAKKKIQEDKDKTAKQIKQANEEKEESDRAHKKAKVDGFASVLSLENNSGSSMLSL